MIRLAVDNTPDVQEPQGFKGRPPEEITKALIDRLAREPGSAKDTYIQDTEVPGFKVRKKKHNGAISFVFIGRVRGGEHQIVNRTIGLARGKGAMTLTAARAKAVKLRDKLSEGIDPLQEQRARELEQRGKAEADKAKRKEDDRLSKWTVGFALEDFLTWRQSRPEGKLRSKSVSFYREAIGYVPSLAKLSVERLTVDAVRQAIDQVPTVAKRAKARRALSKVVGHALMRSGSDKANPVKRLSRGEYAPPKPRTTYLQEEQIVELVEGVTDRKKLRSALQQTQRDYILLNLLCAPRKEELMRLEWANVDLDRGCYTVPDSKTHEGYMLPLTRWTEQIFRRRYEARGNSAHVFPGRIKGKPLTDVRKVLADTFGQGYKLHDSRRTMASHCPSLGIIGIRLKHLLHHKTSDITEGGYTQAIIATMRADLTKYHEWIEDTCRFYAAAKLDPGLLKPEEPDEPPRHWPGAAV